MKSPLTGNEMRAYCSLEGVNYWQDETFSLFSGCLPQAEMVGGTGNREWAHDFRNSLLPDGRILDYGCGRGDFVEFLISQGKTAEGYDPYNLQFAKLPEGNFDAVTMIEVIEHTCDPYQEIDEISLLLKRGGLLFVETSFSNWVTIDHPYLNPKIGHSTIFSHAGLDLLMKRKGFRAGKHPNANIRFFFKE